MEIITGLSIDTGGRMRLPPTFLCVWLIRVMFLCLCDGFVSCSRESNSYADLYSLQYTEHDCHC